MMNAAVSGTTTDWVRLNLAPPNQSYDETSILEVLLTEDRDRAVELQTLFEFVSTTL